MSCQAAAADGKTAATLQKLQLFRSFYLMVRLRLALFDSLVVVEGPRITPSPFSICFSHTYTHAHPKPKKKVVAYIYFTRIVVALVEATLPYDLLWLQHLFDEGATLAFYVLTVRSVGVCLTLWCLCA